MRIVLVVILAGYSCLAGCASTELKKERASFTSTLKVTSDEKVKRQPKPGGNHPIFKRPDFWTSRGKFQLHGGCDAANAHVRALIVVSP